MDPKANEYRIKARHYNALADWMDTQADASKDFELAIAMHAAAVAAMNANRDDYAAFDFASAEAKAAENAMNNAMAKRSPPPEFPAPVSSPVVLQGDGEAVGVGGGE